jgi:hypothetical protein
MNFSRITALFFLAAAFLNSNIAEAAEDRDWHWGEEAIHSQGNDMPADGKLFGIAAIKDNIQITFRLMAKNDMSIGNWIGDIRAPEKFYVKFYLVDQNGNKKSFNVKGARAVGEDADYGSWKDGPATAAQQAMTFKFSWDQAVKIKGNKTLIVNFASFENKDETIDILFPLDTYDANLSELEAAVRAIPGSREFLMTDKDIRSMPINHLPANISTSMIKQLGQAAEILDRDKNDLMKLSFDQVEALLDGKREADRAAKRAAKKAAHQAIYDQKPDWRDLNICPKPDVGECRNIGRLGYEIDNLFKQEYDSGKIIGVVWRSEGSIVHIYGGSLELDIDPEIVRAKIAQYFYVLENDKGFLELRSAKGMLLR